MKQLARRCVVQSCIACGLALLAGLANAEAGPETDPGRARIEDCVARAAQHHRVNQAVLRAILRVESNLNPRAIGRNADGSVDLGIGQINSRHFAALARHGIRPQHLMDGCIGTYVAAWHLATLVSAHGNKWATIARYHSATPSLNHRYQVLLANELVAAGVISGSRMPVPAIRRPSSHDRKAAQDENALVLDENLIPSVP